MEKGLQKNYIVLDDSGKEFDKLGGIVKGIGASMGGCLFFC